MLKLALGQIDVHKGEVERNFQIVQEYSTEASRENCQLVLFPELWSTGYDLENWQRLAQPIHAGIFSKVASLARQNQIWIGGSTLEKDTNKAFNTFSLYTDQGDLAGLYRKLHLFRLMDEHTWLASGDRLSTVQSPWGLLGCAICYDLRFPEMFRKYALLGAKIILLPAEWPSVRIQHWQTLLRARAIENQVFIVAVNRTGSSGSDHFNGHSMIINPWGEILLEAGEEEALLPCEINLEEVDQARSKIPILTDRRPDVYG